MFISCLVWPTPLLFSFTAVVDLFRQAAFCDQKRSLAAERCTEQSCFLVRYFSSKSESHETFWMCNLISYENLYEIQIEFW